tara:strand:+ start:60 stop:272 length:213 start_codon:yes stop_codon:yes gene_type:complete
MKTIILLFAASFIISSCTKTTYCATCTEAVSGYTPDDYCAEEESVDVYINELYTAGAAANQNWSCSKYSQ